MDATAPVLFICPDQSTADAVATVIPGADTAVDALDGATATSIRDREIIAVLEQHMDRKAMVPDAVREFAADALERGCQTFVTALPWGCSGLEDAPQSWQELVSADPDMAAFMLTTARQPALAPDYPDTAHDLREAERLLDSALGLWADGIAHYGRGERKTPPQSAQVVSVGVGKSERALRMIANNPALRGKRIAYFVPSHELAEELMDRYQQLAGPDSPRPLHWRGRLQNGMCKRPALVETLTRAGMSVRSNACRRNIAPGVTVKCPLYDACAFIALESEAARLRDDPRGAVVFLPHAFLRMGADAGPLKNQDGDSRQPTEVAIIDESFWSGMVAARPGILMLDTLCEMRIVPAHQMEVEAQDVPEDGELPEPDSIDREATDELAKASAIVREMVLSGRFNLTELAKEGFTKALLVKLKGWEYKCDVRIKLNPAAPDDAGMAAIRARAAASRRCKARARFWSILAGEIEQADTRERVGEEGKEKIAPLNGVVVQQDRKGRHAFVMHWANNVRAFNPWKTSTLLLDATADPGILRRFLPTLRDRDVGTIRARDVNALVTQVTDTGLGKSSIIDHPDNDDDKLKWKAGRRRDLAHLVQCLRRIHGRAALVCNMELEEQMLAELGKQIDPATAALAAKLADYGDEPASDAVADLGSSLPIDLTRKSAETVAEDVLRTAVEAAGIELRHFNAIRGLDGWRKVPAMIIAGRPQASPAATDHLTRAINGPGRAAIRREEAEVAKRIGVLRMRNGGMQVVRYTDCLGALQRAVMRQVREAELVQAIGRARLARRSGGDRCAVYILSNVPIDITVDHASRLADLEPDRRALTVLETGVLLRSPAELARVHPTLWSKEAAKKADQRLDDTPARSKHSRRLVRAMIGPNPIRVRYRLPGQGKRPVKAVLPQSAAGFEREALEAIVGEVVMLEIYDGDEEEAREAA